MEKIEELKLLNKVKNELLRVGEMKVRSWSPKQINILEINSDDWHRIFKTEEFNEIEK